MKPLESGESILLIDHRAKRFLVTLEAGRSFQTDLGTIGHDALIGSADGSWVTLSSGAEVLLIRPRLADYLLRMKRAAQVVYPKDLGPILVYGDISPGTTVLEAGSGSGALTLALSRAVGDGGRVVSVDLREDHSKHARATLRRWYGADPPNVTFLVGDVADVVGEVAPDRLILDLPDPEPVLRKAVDQMPDGAVICCYLPTVPQVEKAVYYARESRRMAEIEVKEMMMRDWNVSGRSVRPAHQMIGHTGFLVFMRKVALPPEEEPTSPTTI